MAPFLHTALGSAEVAEPTLLSQNPLLRRLSNMASRLLAYRYHGVKQSGNGISRVLDDCRSTNARMHTVRRSSCCTSPSQPTVKLLLRGRDPSYEKRWWMIPCSPSVQLAKCADDHIGRGAEELTSSYVSSMLASLRDLPCLETLGFWLVHGQNYVGNAIR